MLIFFMVIGTLLLSACHDPECLSGDCVNGQGIALYPDGSKYEGYFKEGEKHGQGTWTFPNGGIIKGHFEDDKFIRP